MKVSSTGSSRGVSGTDRKKGAKDKVEGSDFASHLREATATERVAGTYEPLAVSGVDAMLAAQEVPHATEERARNMARQRGSAILERLEELRIGVVEGELSKRKLAELAQLLREKRPRVSDPRLIALLDEIELRAEVEIAKYTRAP